MRTGWPPHLVAGMTEDDYVRSGLAAEVWNVVYRVLIDQQKAEAHKPKRR